MYYVYILKSERDETYIGFTSNLRRRFDAHIFRFEYLYKRANLGIDLHEAYVSVDLARKRERVLKGHGRTKQALLKRLNGDD